MKKLLFLLLLCALVVGGFYLGMNFGSKKTETEPTNIATNTSTNVEEKIETPSNTSATNTLSPLSIMTDEIYYEKAIEFVKAEKTKEEDHINTKPDYHKFAEYEGFGVDEEDDVTYVYMWIGDMSYYKENDKIKQGSGSSTAYKVKFENGEAVSYENPTDGAGQEKSIRAMFPEEVAEKILSYEFDFSVLDEAANKYYNN